MRFLAKRSVRQLLWIGGGLLLAGILLVISLSGRQKIPQPITADGNAGQVAYLERLGWQVRADPVETLHLRLPEDMQSAFGEYLALQEAQGLPFASYGGQEVVRYTYTLENYPEHPADAQANLFVQNGCIIGADVVILGAEGRQAGLDFPT